MINFTQRLDRALRIAAWAHEQQGQHRKGTAIPYIIHPFGVMLVAGSVTDDEDILIACLMHDVLEDVAAGIYDQTTMRADFGDRVVDMVLDVTKDVTVKDWHARARAYLAHLELESSDGAVIVSAADKIHNLMSIVADYDSVGDELWSRFSTKSASDQIWWYQSILAVISKRVVPLGLVDQLTTQLAELELKTSRQSAPART